MQYGFGIDVGGTTVKIAYFDENGTLLDKWEIPTVTKDAGKQILPDIADAVATYMIVHTTTGAADIKNGEIIAKHSLDRGYYGELIDESILNADLIRFDER